MPGSHTSASTLADMLLCDTAAPSGVFARAEWTTRVRLGTGRGGEGVITGVVRIKGAPNYPVRRKVRLYRDRDGQFAGETFSDPVTGVYTFTGLDRAARYTAIAFDDEFVFRAAPADNLLPGAAT